MKFNEKYAEQKGYGMGKHYYENSKPGC